MTKLSEKEGWKRTKRPVSVFFAPDRAVSGRGSTPPVFHLIGVHAGERTRKTGFLQGRQPCSSNGNAGGTAAPAQRVDEATSHGSYRHPTGSDAAVRLPGRQRALPDSTNARWSSARRSPSDPALLGAGTAVSTTSPASPHSAGLRRTNEQRCDHRVPQPRPLLLCRFVCLASHGHPPTPGRGTRLRAGARPG